MIWGASHWLAHQQTSLRSRAGWRFCSSRVAFAPFWLHERSYFAEEAVSVFLGAHTRFYEYICCMRVPGGMHVDANFVASVQGAALHACLRAQGHLVCTSSWVKSGEDGMLISSRPFGRFRVGPPAGSRRGDFHIGPQPCMHAGLQSSSWGLPTVASIRWPRMLFRTLLRILPRSLGV